MSVLPNKRITLNPLDQFFVALQETSKYSSGPGNAKLQNRLLDLMDHRSKLMVRQ